MKRKDCADAGHCWHLDGGDLWQRGIETRATCCWCAAIKEPVPPARTPPKPIAKDVGTHGIYSGRPKK